MDDKTREAMKAMFEGFDSEQMAVMSLIIDAVRKGLVTEEHVTRAEAGQIAEVLEELRLSLAVEYN